MNPNRAFKRRGKPKYVPYDRFADLMITEVQLKNINYRMSKHHIHWTTITILAIGKTKPIAELTFYEASACLEKLRECGEAKNEPK